MSCEATPAHASEPFEWRIRQRSRHGSRFSEAERRRTALFSQNECAAEVKVESLPFRVILSDEVDCCQLNVRERLAIRNVSGEELLYL